MHRKFIFLIKLVCFSCFAHCQEFEAPKLVYQSPIKNGLQRIKVNEKSGHFLTIEGDLSSIVGAKAKLWDLNSRTLIAERSLLSQNFSNGQVELLDDGSFLINQNHAIVRLNLVLNTIDTIFQTTFPEYIHRYALQENELLVATKSFSAKEFKVYETSNISKLYLINFFERKILFERDFNLEFTFLSYSGENILAATNVGTCLFLDKNLKEYRAPFELYPKGAARYLFLTKDSVLVSNESEYNKEENFFWTEIGKGSLDLFDLRDEKQVRKIELLKDTSSTKKEDFIYFPPSNDVHEIFYIPERENLLVFYGHYSIGSFDLENFVEEKHQLNLKNQSINLLSPIPNSDQVIISFGEYKIFRFYNNFAFADLQSNRIREIVDFEEKIMEQFFPVTIGDQKVWFGRPVSDYSYYNHDTIEIRNNPMRKGTILVSDRWKIDVSASTGTWLFTNDFSGIAASGIPNQDMFSFDTLYINSSESLNKYFDDVHIVHFDRINPNWVLQSVVEYLDKHDQYVLFLRDKKYSSEKRCIAIVNLEGEILYDLQFKNLTFKHLLTEDQNTIVLHPEFSKFNLIVLDYKQKWLERNLEIETDWMPHVQIDQQNRQVFYHKYHSTNESRIVSLDLATLSHETTIYSGTMCSNFFVDRNRNILYNICNEEIQVIDLKNNSILRQMRGGNAAEVFYYEEENRIYIRFKDHSVLIDLISQESINFYNLENDATAIFCDDGYYMTEKSAVSKFGFKLDDKAYHYSQFDLQYNRPDIVLDRIGYSEDKELKALKLAYDKRTKLAGIKNQDEIDAIEIPSITITNKKQIRFLSNKSSQEIAISCSSKTQQIAKIHVWINSVPIYGASGITLINQSRFKIDTNIQVQLSYGENKIELAVANDLGIESYKETIYINADYPQDKKRLYFIGIGAESYKDSNLNLSYSVKDIQDITSILSTSTQFDEVIIDTLLNSSISKKKIQNLRSTLQKSNVNDQIIFMYSGHGFLSENFDYYLSSYTIDPMNPKLEGIPYEMIDNLLDGIPARKKLILIDACHSGEIDKEEVKEKAVDSPIKVKSLAKGKLFKELGTTTNTFELMREVFTDLRRGTGATVIASSAGLYFSFEDDEFQNGLYTYALKEGLLGAADYNQDKIIQVSELKSYLYHRVGQLSDGKQKPSTRQENLEFDFRVY